MIEDFRLLNLAEAYIEGNLSPGEAEELAGLLEGSAEILAAFRSLLAMDHYLREATDLEREPASFRRAVLERIRSTDAGPVFRNRILDRIREQKALSSRSRWMRRVRHVPSRPMASTPLLWASLAAAFLVAVLAVFFLGRGAPEPKIVRAVVKAPAEGIAKEEPVPPPPADRAETPPPAPSRMPAPPQTAVEQPAVLPPAPPAREIPSVAEVPVVPTPVEATPRRPSRPTTVPAVARLQSVRGRVLVLDGAATSPGKAGQDLPNGAGLQTPDKGSRAVAAYPDGTRLDVEPGTTILRLTEGDAGRRVDISKGVFTAMVARQAEDCSMTFVTPHAEATVLGTRFKLVVDEKSTRLEVNEGRVRLTRTEDGASVEVAAGQAGTVAKGLPLTPVPLRPSATAEKGRVLDNFEGTMAWVPREEAPSYVDFKRVPGPGGGGHALQVTYRTPPEGVPPQVWWMTRPLHLKPGDGALSFRMRVLQAQPGAHWAIDVFESDNDAWRIGTGAIEEGGDEWQQITVPFPAKPTTLGQQGGDGRLTDWRSIRFISFVLGPRPVTLLLDDLTLIPRRPDEGR